jgi:hypothetical protein
MQVVRDGEKERRMLLRVGFCVVLAACPVLADSLTTQPAGSVAGVTAEMRAIERRVADELSKNGDYAALKAKQGQLERQLESCDDKDRPALAEQKFAVTQQIDAIEKAELAKDAQYTALKGEYEQLMQEAAKRAKDAKDEQSASASERPSGAAGAPASTSGRNRTTHLRIGARKSGVTGMQTFTPQR